MTTATVTSSIEDLELPGTLTTFSNWIEAKPKYFIESLYNSADWVSKILGQAGYAASSTVWDNASKGLNTCKKLLAFPAAIKGSMTLYEKVSKGGELARNLAGDVCYVINDTIDGLEGFSKIGILSIPDAIFKGALGTLKNLVGIYGLGNTTHNLTIDMEKLKQVDLTKLPHKGIKDPVKALEIRKNWIDAEFNSKWHDRIRCVSAIAMCSLGLMTSITGIGVPGIVFTTIVTVSLIVGKYPMFANKEASAFWQSRYAEQIGTAQSSNKAVKISK